MLLIITLVVSMFVGAGQTALAAVPTAAQSIPAIPERFDMIVRADFFAGFSGDADRLARGMATCERYLAADPNHAEALVWHGGGLVFQAGAAFNLGDMARGGELWARGVAEMDRAVALEPDNVGVRIPRGAVLLQAAHALPEAQRRPVLQRAVDDYQRALALQTPYFTSLSTHARGQLLFGLADGSARLGRADKAREYFSRLLSDAPESALAPQASQWLSRGTLPAATGLGCVGCHK